MLIGLGFALSLSVIVQPTPQVQHLNNGHETKKVSIAQKKEPTVKEEAKVEEVPPAPIPQAEIPPPVVEPPAPPPPAPIAPTGGKYDWMAAAGISPSDYEATDFIVSHESSWNPFARNASSGAYGLCQSLPASKMASEGEDYMTNPVTQLRWCHKYAHQRYGGWWPSFAFWQASRWW